MPEFFSLSDVIRKQIQDSNSKRDSLLNIHSTLALTVNVDPTIPTTYKRQFVVFG